MTVRAVQCQLGNVASGSALQVVGYSPLGGGMLTGKYRRGETGRNQSIFSKFLHREEEENNSAILDMVEGVAQEASAIPVEVAISWVMSKEVIPIAGPRNPKQLRWTYPVLVERLPCQNGE